MNLHLPFKSIHCMLSRDAISMKASEFENIAEDSVLRHDGNTNGEQLFILYDR